MQTYTKQFSKNNNTALCKRRCNCYRLEMYPALPSGCSGAAASKAAVTAGCGVKIPAFSPARTDENSSENIQQIYRLFFSFLNGVLSSSYCYLPPHTMAVAFSVPSRKSLNKLQIILYSFREKGLFNIISLQSFIIE